MNYSSQIKAYTLFLLFINFIFLCSAQKTNNVLRVTKQLYMIGGYGGNVSFLVTTEGVLVVDAGTLPCDAVEIQGIIKSITNYPIKYIVLTNYHFDHAFGLCGFDKNIRTIAHENTIKNLKKFGSSSKEYFCETYLKRRVERTKLELEKRKKADDDTWLGLDSVYKIQLADYDEAKKIEICEPDSSFVNDIDIVLGDDTISLVYPGATHSDGGILVVFKNQHTIAAGDFFFNSMMPYIDYQAGSNTLNWINKARELSAKNFRYIIPGHGSLTGGKKIIQQAEYLMDLRNQINEMIQLGNTLDEIKNNLKMGKYKHYGLQFMLASEIEAIYKELTITN